MEVLKVENDSDIWVPHVSGGGRVKGGVGRGTIRISREAACVATCVACAGVPNRQKGHVNEVSNKSGRYVGTILTMAFERVSTVRVANMYKARYIHTAFGFH
jgi:hypothetical protein